MAKRFELLVFDWDGTLLDSAGAIVAAPTAIQSQDATAGFVLSDEIGLHGDVFNESPEAGPAETKSRCDKLQSSEIKGLNQGCLLFHRTWF